MEIGSPISLASPTIQLAAALGAPPGELSTTSGAPLVVTLNAPTWTAGFLTEVHKLWKKNVLCDTNIKCLNNETVTAHSLVLSASSPFLRGFFSQVSTQNNVVAYENGT